MINNYGSFPFYAATASGRSESSNSSSNPQEGELIWPALDLLESMNESDLQTTYYELQNQEIPFTDAIESQQLQEPEQPIQETEKEIITSKAAKSRRGHPWIEGGEEEQRLAQAVKELGTRSWALITERMGNERTQRAYEMQYVVMKARKELLVAPNITEVFGGVPEQANRHENQYNGNVEWRVNSEQVPAAGTIESQLPQRPVQEKETISSNIINSRYAQEWKEEEEQRLAQAVKELGTRSWALITERMGNERTRSAYQSRYAVMKAREKLLVAPIINAGQAIFSRMGGLSTPTASRKRNITEVSGGVPEQPNRHENQYNDNVEWETNNFWLLME